MLSGLKSNPEDIDIKITAHFKTGRKILFRNYWQMGKDTMPNLSHKKNLWLVSPGS